MKYIPLLFLCLMIATSTQAQREIELGLNRFEVAEKLGQDPTNPSSLIYDLEDQNISMLSESFFIYNFEEKEISGTIYFAFDSSDICFCVFIISECYSSQYDLPFYNKELKQLNETGWVGKEKRFKYYMNSNQFENYRCSFCFWTKEIDVPETWEFIKYE